MNKKILIFSIITIFIISAATMSFAYGGYGHMGQLGESDEYSYGHMNGYRNSDISEEDMAKHHEDMVVLRSEYLDKQLEDGEITQEQYDLWKSHFNEFSGFNGLGRGCGRRIETEVK